MTLDTLSATINPPFHQLLLLPLLVLSGTSAVTAQAQQQTPHYLSVIAENDIYAPRGQDRHYSNGVRVAFGLERERSWYSWLGKLAQAGSPEYHSRYELAFGHNIYTPEYYSNGLPLPQDRPYAGWLYSELSATVQQPGRADHIAINLGLIGPAAMGKQAQKLIHDLVGDPEPAGWSNQLRNEPAVLLRYRRSWFIGGDDAGPLHADIVPAIGFNAGNVFTDAGAGLSVRMGNHLPQQDLPLRIQPGLSGSPAHIPVRKQQFDWMLHAGVQGRAVLRNIFLDGNTFSKNVSVDKRNFVHDLSTGFVLGFGQFSMPAFMAFTLVWRGREFERQQGTDSFGSIMIGMSY